MGPWGIVTNAALVYANYHNCAQLKSLFTRRWGHQIGEVTCGGLPHLSCKRDHIKMREYMDRQVIPPKRVTSLIWGTLPPCKQARRQGKHQDSRENKTNWFPEGPDIKCFVIFLDFHYNVLHQQQKNTVQYRKWFRDRKWSPKWTANDPRPQVIPKVDRKWSRKKNRDDLDSS